MGIHGFRFPVSRLPRQAEIDEPERASATIYFGADRGNPQGRLVPRCPSLIQAIHGLQGSGPRLSASKSTFLSICGPFRTINDCMDAGDRATHGAVAEKEQRGMFNV